MDSEGISDGLPAERKVEIRVRKNGRKDKVIVEKSAAEGLPQGWIKKLVITYISGRKIRRDSFFIDPKSEYIFQSFRNASWYAETGDIGNYARKLNKSDIEDDDTILLLESGEKKRSADGLLEKEKNMNVSVKDGKRRNLSSSKEHSENSGKVNSDLSSITSQVLEDPIEKHTIGKRVTRSQAKANKNVKSEEDTVKSRLSSASPQDAGKETIRKEEKVLDSTEKRITGSKAKVVKKKNEIISDSVVRRASKRLAGIELEPTPELKTRTKAQRVVPPDDGTAGKCKQLVAPTDTSGLMKSDVSLNTEVAKSCNEHSSPKPDAATTSNNRVRAEIEVKIKKTGKSVGSKASVDKKKMKTPMVISEAELNPVFHLDGYKHKEEMSPVSPLSSQTSATKREKTAAGKGLRRSSPEAKLTSAKATKISPFGSFKNDEHLQPFSNANAIERRNKFSNESSKPSVVRGTCSEVVEKNTNSFTSSFDSTLADLLKDPCIAFAIKTLTGETLRLPSTTEISSDPKDNHSKQKGVAFFTETPGDVNTGSEKPATSSGLPGADIWQDPCIDFAIRTLTGATPIGSERMTNTAATQEREGRQSSCDYLVKQCSSNMKDKTMAKSGDLRFPQSFSKN